MTLQDPTNDFTDDEVIFTLLYEALQGLVPSTRADGGGNRHTTNGLIRYDGIYHY